MSDYISREAAIEDFEQCNQKNSTWTPQRVKTLLMRIPAADVEPVRHGRWEGYTHSRYCGTDKYGEPAYSDGVVYYCSNPKCRRKTVIKENYCPSCGSKMDLEGENNDD